MSYEKKMLELNLWAVVGANTDSEKYGNKIYRTLKSRGYTVYAVNPKYDRVDDDPCYPDLTALPVKPEVINMVVSPKLGKATVEAAAELGIPHIWFQPGTVDGDLLALANAKGLEVVEGCVLVALAARI